MRRAEVTLQHEREWLAAQLKATFSDEDREQLFARWHITQYKERKKALSLRLWDPSVRHHSEAVSFVRMQCLVACAGQHVQCVAQWCLCDNASTLQVRRFAQCAASMLSAACTGAKSAQSLSQSVARA
jgi:hypothetical protein